MSKDKKNSLNKLIDKYKDLSVVSEIQNNLSSLKPTTINISSIQVDELYDTTLYNLDLYDKLTTSIKNDGILTPVIVNNKSNLIDGIKRYLIARKLNINNIPCYFISIDDNKKNQYMLINLLTKNDNILIKSHCLNILINKYKFSENKVKELTNISISNIKNIIRINTLPNYIKEDLINNKISYGHARSLLNLDEKDQKELYDELIKNKISVRDIEKLKHKYIGSKRNSLIELKDKKIIIKFTSQEETIKNYEKLKKIYSK